MSTAGLPLGVTMLLDATQPSTIQLLGSTPLPGSNVDTWGIAIKTGANQPIYDPIGLAGGPSIVFGGQGAPLVSTPSWLVLASNAYSFPCTIFGVISCDTDSTMFELSSNSSSSPGISLRSSNTATVIATNGSGTMTATAPATWASDNALCYFELYCDGTKAGTTLRKNGVPVALTPSGSDPGGGPFTTIGYVGADHAQATPSSMRWGCLGVSVGQWSSSDRAQFDAWARARWRIPPLTGAARYVQGIGDSIMAANGVNVVSVETKAYSFLNRACDWMGANWKANFNNWAVSGAQMGGAVAARDIPWQITNRFIPNLVNGQVNIGVLQGGINDFNVALAQASTWFSQFNNTNTVNGYWNTDALAMTAALAAVTGGLTQHLFVMTITYDASTSVTAYQDQARQFTNAYIRSTYPVWVASAASPVLVHLVDGGADYLLGQPNGANVFSQNTNYFVDNEHPAKPGHDRYASLLMNAFLRAGL